MTPTAQHTDLWLRSLRRYFGAVLPLHLLWEVAQLPLYTIWWDGTPGEIAFAVVHCTGGDALIAMASLVGAILFLGRRWPSDRAAYMRVAATTVFTGVAYTVFSEWLNTAVRGTWAYTELMPTIPPLDAGLSPILQWILIPIAGFWWARRPLARAMRTRETYA